MEKALQRIREFGNTIMINAMLDRAKDEHFPNECTGKGRVIGDDEEDDYVRDTCGSICLLGGSSFDSLIARWRTLPR